jgi:uroporphyrinogen-III synthase
MSAGSPSARPLAGRIVALTRPRDRIRPYVRAFRAAGAETIICPVLRLVPVEGAERAKLERALRTFVDGGEGWIAFTSASVPPVVARLLAADHDLRDLCARRLRVAAVGKATAETAWSRGFAVALEGEGEGAEALAKQLLAVEPRPRVLHITSDRGLPTLVRAINAAGGTASRIIAVEHRPEPTLDPAALFRSRPAELVVIASPSAAEGLLDACTAAQRRALVAIPALALGETTAASLRAHGFREVIVSALPAPEALVAAACARLRRGGELR